MKNLKPNIHSTNEDRLAFNTEQSNSSISETNQKLDEVKQSIKDLHGTAKDQSVSIDGFIGVIKNLQKNTESIDNLKDYIDHPEVVVKKLEEVKSASLITNQELKKLNKKEIPKTEFPKEMEVSLKGISVVTIKGDKGEKGIDGKDADEPKIIKEVLNKIPTPKDGKNGTNGKDGKNIDENRVVRAVLSKIPTPKDGLNGNNGKDGSPDTSDEIVGKINSSSKKIKAKQIEGLPSLMKEINDRDTMNQVGFSTGGIGDLSLMMFAQDLSSQCDGANKVFTIPQNRMILSLTCTEFPIIYRPVIDFTVSGISRETLTLTDQVSGPASGQTLIVMGIRP